jgi:hypothetical protein
MDGPHNVVHLAVIGAGVVDVVGHDDRQSQLPGECRRLRHEPVIVRQEVVLELQVEAVEPVGIRLRHGSRSLPIPDPQAPRDLPVAAARQDHNTLGVFGEERLAEVGHALCPGEVGPRHDPAQAPIPLRAPREQDQVRTKLPLADATNVLLDRLAVAGQPCPCRPWADGPALGWLLRRQGDLRRWRAAASREPT